LKISPLPGLGGIFFEISSFEDQPGSPDISFAISYVINKFIMQNSNQKTPAQTIDCKLQLLLVLIIACRFKKEN